MIKMNKKFLSLMLALVMVIGSMGISMAALTDVGGIPEEQAILRLEGLKILEGYGDGTFLPNNLITREEYAAVITRAKRIQQISGNTVFGDVPASRWSAPYINAAEQSNLINGRGIINGVNTFDPVSNISYEEAVTIVVRALGYETLAQSSGGYPNGYLLVAAQKGLLAGVSGTLGMKAPRAMVAQLTFNALEVPQQDGSYLFKELRMINLAAKSTDWTGINVATFAAAGINGVTASNLANLKSTLEGAANGTNQNWSPTDIQGVVDSVVDSLAPKITYINGREFDLVVPNTPGTFILITTVGGVEESAQVVNGRVIMPAFAPATFGTAKLYNLNDLNTPLVSENFVIKAPSGITGTMVNTTPGVAPLTIMTEVLGIDTVTFGGNFLPGQTVTIDGIALTLVTGGAAAATATEVAGLLTPALLAKYAVVDDTMGKLTFTELTGQVDGIPLTATTSSGMGSVLAANTTLGTIGSAGGAGVAQVNTLTVAAGVVSEGEITVTFKDGSVNVVKTIPIVAADTAITVANKIKTAFGTELADWNVGSAAANVIFTAKTAATNKVLTIAIAEK